MERWTARNPSSEDARPELGMNTVVERVRLEAFIHAQKGSFITKQNKAACHKVSGQPPRMYN
jgi:hypothetical protein